MLGGQSIENPSTDMESAATFKTNSTGNTTTISEAGFHPGFTTLISCGCLIVILLIYMWFEPKVSACCEKANENPKEENRSPINSTTRLRYLWSKQRYLDATEGLQKQRVWRVEQQSLARNDDALIRVNDYRSVVDTSASRTTPLVFVTSPSDLSTVSTHETK